MGKYKNPVFVAMSPIQALAGMPNTDGMPKVPIVSCKRKEERPGQPYPIKKVRTLQCSQQVVDKAASVADDMKVSRGEVPATADEVIAARKRLNGWLAEGALRTEEEKMADLKRDSAVGLQQVALSRVFEHLCGHYDVLLDKCKEWDARYGRGALLIRVRHVSQASRQVVVDWVTAEELKDRCFFTYWQAMQYNRDTEIMIAACFSDMSGRDGCQKSWYGGIFTKALASEWKQKFRLSPALRPWVPVTRLPLPLQCMGKGCAKTVGEGSAQWHACGECRDAVFCSKACSETAHECQKFAFLRGGVDLCIKHVGPVFHKGSRGVTPRCPHKWDVSSQ
eukprot:jgi/Mesvir1/14130/Mv23080-RA.1